MNNCYTLNMYTNTFERKENMNEPRYEHGLQKMALKIFAFGGYGSQSPIKSAEVYDVMKNSWDSLTDMPRAGSQITCVRVKNQILITNWRFRLISYDTENQAYSYVGK